MVSKCSLVGCRSRYMKKKVKMHRFPLTNLNILPSWIAFMRKEAHWKPKRSSRLCSNHFIESDYKFKHGKGVLNPTSVPSIEYRVKVPVKFLYLIFKYK
ncbi:THAP domain-containing protein 1-like [Melanaphis sacchari]|uniref:THAP domain-containing protein 1-like n=1 Tax=Melanaphis sacchari TaxID=742174 RepID=UPI000DC12F0F|nr:THAP domain-containing protein 1-like [Melanaphis sacchari]